MRLIIPLFSPATGTQGGLTRVIALAQAAGQAGHAVAFCASGYLEKSLRERGFRVYSTPSTTMLGLPQPISQWMAKRSQNAAIPVKPGKSFGNIWFVLMLSGMAQARYLHRLVDAELAAVRDFHADGLLTDLDLGAYLAANVAGIPIATAFQNVMLEGKGSFAWKVVGHAVESVLQTYSKPVISPDELAFGPTVLKIIPSIPELEGADPCRADICYVGHLLGEIKAEKQAVFRPEDGKRYIFVYVGTGSVTQKTLRSVLPKLLSQNSSLKAIVGGSGGTAPEVIGPVEFHPYVSADALLPYCDWTLCHGGQNTIIQSLMHGVPLMIFPGPIFERRFNARKIQQAGAGMLGEIPDFNPAWINSVMANQPEHAANARTLGSKIASYGGAARAIAATEKWIKSHP